MWILNLFMLLVVYPTINSTFFRNISNIIVAQQLVMAGWMAFFISLTS